MNRHTTLLLSGLLAATMLPSATFAQQLSLPYAWAHSGGGTSDDTGRCLAVDNAGNVYVAGRFVQDAVFGTDTVHSIGGQDVFLTKYNAQGNVEWVRCTGADGNDSAIGIDLDAAGNVFVTGYFIGSTCTFDTTAQVQGAGYVDIFLAKYNPQGALQWARSAGSPGDDEGWGVSVDGAGNAAITGFFDDELRVDSSLIVDNPGRHGFVALYNAQGQPQWARSLDMQMIYGRGISTDTNGDIFVTGEYSFNGTDGFLVKYNAAGIEQWSRTFGGPGDDFGISVAADGYGGVFVTGRHGGGRLHAQASFSPACTITSAGFLDAFLAKYDSQTGNVMWASSAGGSGIDYGTCVAVDQYGNPLMTGFFNGTATFGTQTLTGGLQDNAFRTWYDYQGNALGAYAPATSGGWSWGYGVTQDLQGNMYETGAFSGSTSFDSYGLNSSGNLDAYVAKVSADLARLHPARPLGIAAAAPQAQVDVYPNPAGPTQDIRLTITAAHAPQARLDVFDALGRRVLSRTVALDAAGSGSASLPALAGGLYTARILTGSAVATRSLIVR